MNVYDEYRSEKEKLKVINNHIQALYSDIRKKEDEIQSIKEQIYKEQTEYRIKSVNRVLDYIRHEYGKGNIVNLDMYLCHCQNKLNGNIDGTELDLKEVEECLK